MVLCFFPTPKTSTSPAGLGSLAQGCPVTPPAPTWRSSPCRRRGRERPSTWTGPGKPWVFSIENGGFDHQKVCFNLSKKIWNHHFYGDI